MDSILKLFNLAKKDISQYRNVQSNFSQAKTKQKKEVFAITVFEGNENESIRFLFLCSHFNKLFVQSEVTYHCKFN